MTIFLVSTQPHNRRNGTVSISKKKVMVLFYFAENFFSRKCKIFFAFYFIEEKKLFTSLIGGGLQVPNQKNA
jgi:hypothetical protein